MEKNNPEVPSYEYIYLGGTDSEYGFITDKGITYEAKFKPSPYVLGDDFPYA